MKNHADFPSLDYDSLVDFIAAAHECGLSAYAAPVTGGFVLGAEMELDDGTPRVKKWSLYGPVDEDEADQLIYNAWLNAKPLQCEAPTTEH